MKLSIIVPVYKNSKFLEKYVERLGKIATKNYEVIFVVDTNTEKVLQIIEEGLLNIKGEHKIVYNSKRVGRASAVDLGILQATGDYLIIQSLSNRFEDNFVTQLLVEAGNKKSDIIEFRPYIVSPLRFKAKLRKNFIKTVDLEKNKSVIAYSYPLIFNKIFKVDVAKKAVLQKSINKRINSRLSIDLLYKMFANAKTYSSISIAPMKSYVNLVRGFNPLEVSREWDQIWKSEFFAPFKQELAYVRYFNGVFLMPAYIKALKNPVLQKKFAKKINTVFASDSDFFTLNKYYLSSTKEANKMRELKGKASPKAYKEL